MRMVRFVKPWRGHALEAVAELTDERAAELLGQKFCVAYVVPAEPTPPVEQPVEDVQRVEVVEPETVEPETVEPEPDKTPRRRRRRASE